LKEAKKVAMHTNVNKEKYLATISHGDSFFGADEWKKTANPNEEMEFQKFSLAPTPAYTLEIVGADNFGNVSGQQSSHNSIVVGTVSDQQNSSRQKIGKARDSDGSKMSKVSPIPIALGK
jgi:hypothetical protein